MAPIEITLRPATVQDTGVLVELIHRAYAEYRGRLTPPSGAQAETPESIAGLLAREQALIARVDAQEVGCVFYTPREESVYLHRLAVLPAWRRKGIARTLVLAVEDATRQMGFNWVTLGVRIALPENRNLYEGLGYQVAAMLPHPGYDSPTYISMRKQVAYVLERSVVVDGSSSELSSAADADVAPD